MRTLASLSLVLLPAYVLACDAGAVDDPSTPEAAIVEGALGPAGKAAPDGIVSNKELFVTDLSVVDDHKFVDYKAGKWNTDPDGAWSFGRRIDNLIDVDHPTDQQRSDFVMRWLLSWETDQTVNQQTVVARPTIRDVIITPWKLASVGKLGNTAASCDATAATDFICKLSFVAGVVPFDLIAIVNRPDLRMPIVPHVPNSGMAAQGRFIFVALDTNRNPLPFTVIFEYMVPVKKDDDTKAYAKSWHGLGAKPFGGPFNDALKAVTDKFAKRDAAPWRNGDSALLQLRTNEVALAPPGSDPAHPFGVLWEMREFVIGADDQLHIDTTKVEPALSFSNTATLGQWASENQAAILAGTHVVPDTYQGQPFLAGSAIVPFDFAWEVPGATEAVRHQFALNTCNGCHLNETGTFFLHAFPNTPGAEATLSSFLSGLLAPGGERVIDFADVLDLDPAALPPKGPGKDH